MPKLPPSILFVFLVISLSACVATTKNFIRLELSMTKSEVLQTIGDPDIARGSIRNKFGQLIEVWEYHRYVSEWSWEQKRMWVYFCDGRLAQWGEAGDWAQEADRIYEIRFR